MANITKKIQLLNNLPSDIINAISSDTTLLGNGNYISKIFDTSYLELILRKNFNDSKRNLEKIGQINDITDTELHSALSSLIIKCQDIEAPYRNELEKICYNKIIDIFKLPLNFADFKMSLVDKIDDGEISMPIDPIINSESINQEIFKYRFLLMLCMGAGLSISSNIKLYISDIYDINPILPDIYNKIIKLNDYLLYEKADIGINDKDKKLLGTVSVIAKNEGSPEIKSVAKIFPVLFSETIRGIMELAISYSLPNNLRISKEILQSSNYLKAEVWDMRLGTSFWDLLIKLLGDIKLYEMPYIIKHMAKFNSSEFIVLINDMLSNKEIARKKMKKVLISAKKDIYENKFLAKMAKMKEKSIITDEFIYEDEL